MEEPKTSSADKSTDRRSDKTGEAPLAESVERKSDSDVTNQSEDEAELAVGDNTTAMVGEVAQCQQSPEMVVGADEENSEEGELPALTKSIQ